MTMLLLLFAIFVLPLVYGWDKETSDIIWMTGRHGLWSNKYWVNGHEVHGRGPHQILSHYSSKGYSITHHGIASDDDAIAISYSWILTKNK